MTSPDDFRSERERMNAIVFANADITIKRFFALDGATYSPNKLDARTKELLGLVASLVLRCDDCVRYHLLRCKEEGISTQELTEALSVGLIVGGSIVIPHLRRAYDFWEELSHSSERSE